MHLKMPKRSIICNRGSHHLCCAFAYEENVVAFLPASIFRGAPSAISLRNNLPISITTLFPPHEFIAKTAPSYQKRKAGPCSSDLVPNFVNSGGRSGIRFDSHGRPYLDGLCSSLQ